MMLEENGGEKEERRNDGERGGRRNEASSERIDAWLRPQ